MDEEVQQDLGGEGGRGVSQESRVSFGGDDLRGVVRGDEI